MKIGILGCSRVYEDAIIKPGIFEVFGIASRSYDKAVNAAEKYHIDKVYQTYEELVKDSDLNAVYIALPPAIQPQWVEKSLAAGKRVLVEKPLSVKVCDLKRINMLIGSGNILLEGVMTQHHEWQQFIKDVLKSGIYGELLNVDTKINMVIPEEKIGFRDKKELGGGVFFDQGSYWLQFIQFLLGLDFEEYRVSVNKFFRGVDWETTFYGKIGMTDIYFETSYQKKYNVVHNLRFKNAEIIISNFFRAAMGKYKITVEIISGEQKEKIKFDAQNYYENQLQLFEKMDVLDCARYWNETCQRIVWLDKIGELIYGDR